MVLLLFLFPILSGVCSLEAQGTEYKQYVNGYHCQQQQKR